MGFNYKKNKLYCDGVLAGSIAKKFGTPLYVYSYDEIKNNFQAYEKAFKGVPHLVCYALKTNSNIGVAHELAKLGAGIDIVSGGELFRAKKAGFSNNKIVYAGVGKTEDEIAYALKSNILMFNVESMAELEAINKIAGKMKMTARISLRVNPDVDPKTHPYIATGLAESKFGIEIKDARKYYKRANSLKNINTVGVHMHIGSQLMSIEPYVEAVRKILKLVHDLKKDGIVLQYIDCGGGLGISYKGEKAPTPLHLFKKIGTILKKEKLTILLEPGRSIVGNAGILITKVLYNKKSSKKNFIIIDAGMNDLMRPSLYDAYHEIIPLNNTNSKIVKADVVGPICESGDYLAKNRSIRTVNEGDYLAVKSSGAYGFSMSSNYNSRKRAAEVIVKGKKARLVRKRETNNDLIKGENTI
ncbi:MAG: diaminopimelate decarboxylase [Elusimicrobiota bacterium]